MVTRWRLNHFRVLALMLTGGLMAAVVLSLWGPTTLPYVNAQANPPPPPPLKLALGNPTGLSAAPGSSAGSVMLRWSPAVMADLHWAYLVKPNGSGGRFWTASAGDADSAIITGLEAGQRHLFIVIAGQEQASGDAYKWSEWSNWAEGTPLAAALPPDPPSSPPSLK